MPVQYEHDHIEHCHGNVRQCLTCGGRMCDCGFSNAERWLSLTKVLITRHLTRGAARHWRSHRIRDVERPDDLKALEHGEDIVV